ncbi:MAG: hypothetical protein WCP18_02565 [bacterium]
MKELTAKKILATALTIVVLSLFVLPVAVSAGDPFGINKVTVSGLEKTDLMKAINNIITVALSFLGIIGVIIILDGGFMWMTAGGDAGKVDKAKKLITAGIVGMIIILSAYIIANYVLDTFAKELIKA